jgi:hypothetical protein
MEALIAEFLSVLLAAFFKAELPLVGDQVRAATTTTMTDAPADPATTDALLKEQADAIASGQVPPP